MHATRSPLVVLLLALVGCGDGAEPAPAPPLQRSGRYGTLRDLVLLDRSADNGGPFFLDRFEATRADFAEFAASPSGQRVLATMPLPSNGVAAALPMARIDLAQARAFAHWRRCRLPRSDEWGYACSAGGVSSYPWGNDRRSERANTSDLGMFAPLPVGTFESGRAGSGAYDLVGNVAEWTESVPGSWFHSSFSEAPRSTLDDQHAVVVRPRPGPWWQLAPRPMSPLAALHRTPDRRSAADLREVRPAMAIAVRDCLRQAGLACWRLPAGLLSPAWLIALAGDAAPREVVGSDYASSMGDSTALRSPSDRSDTLGVRLCTTPRELLLALAADIGTTTAAEQDALARFCRRDSHAAVLRAALAELELPPAARTYFAGLLP